MKKVHICLYSNRTGDPIVSAIGMVDTESKTLYIPKVSKKGTAYIDVVVCDSITGRDAIQMVYTENDRVFENHYYIHELTEKGNK